MSIQSVKSLNRIPGFSVDDAPRFREGTSHLQFADPFRSSEGPGKSCFLQTTEDGSERVQGAAKAVASPCSDLFLSGIPSAPPHSEGFEEPAVWATRPRPRERRAPIGAGLLLYSRTSVIRK